MTGSNPVEQRDHLVVDGDKQFPDKVRDQPPGAADWPVHHPNDDLVFAFFCLGAVP